MKTLKSYKRNLFASAILALAAVFSSTGVCIAASASWFILPHDLVELAKKAPPETAKLYAALAVPGDDLVTTDGTLRISPLATFPLKKGSKIAISVRVIDAGDQKPVEIGADKVTNFVPYEQTAQETIAAFMASTPDQLAAAETTLKAVLRFHHATRSRDDDWQRYQTRLDDLLRDVCLKRLEKSISDGAVQNAVGYGDELRRVFPRFRKLYPQLRLLWGNQAERAVQENDFASARAMLDRVDAVFAHDKELNKVRHALQERALILMKEAEAPASTTALTKLREAFALWPRLPGLGDALATQQYGERVLYVGVPTLPELLSPDTARSDAELAAVELLFEGLVKPVISESLGQRYVPQLAAGLPDVEPGERRFDLRRDAYWSNGERVTAADVRHTAQHFTPPGWHALVDTPQLEQASFHANFHLRQGLFDPLGLLAFKLLPQMSDGKSLQRDDPAFARNPVGSGPYVYAGQRKEDGRVYAVFRANPDYVRSDEVLPIIREIRFFVWPDAKSEKPVPDLIFDVPADRMSDIRKSARYEVHTLLPNRVHLLAVNHRVKILANENVRRGLAHAIDREAILTTVFRRPYREVPVLGIGNAALALSYKAEEKKLSGLHRVLNGPYPAASWASCPPPRVPEKLHNEELARAFLQKAAAELEGKELTLKYSTYDPRTTTACEGVALQVNKLASDAGVKMQIRPVGIPQAEFAHALDEHDFELAYVHHDYQDETFWLWPWFDESEAALAKGGSNIFGYENDAALLSLLRSAMSQRQFTTLQEVTHAVHARLHERMPFIPLWQLQRTLAVHRALAPTHLDATHVFAQAERWRFQSK